jgi:hypothetical protein
MIRIWACMLCIALPGFHGTHSPAMQYSDWMFQDDEVLDETHVTHET